MNDTIIGVIIGSIITFLSTLIVECIKSHKEEKTYMKRKREEVYLDCVKCLGKLNNERTKPYIDLEYATGLKASLSLYGNKELSNKFKKIVDNLMEAIPNSQDIQVDEFINDIRNILKIKD